MRKALILSLISAFAGFHAHADEGMWMLTDLKQQNAAVNSHTDGHTCCQ